MKEYDELIKRLNLDADPRKFFDLLIKQYTSQNRHYHNLYHIFQCIDEFKEVKLFTEFPDEIEFAIFYHELIYYTRTFDENKNPIPVTNNKDLSALLAREEAKKLGVNDLFCQKIYELILATKHDKLPKNVDEKIIIDVDLTILGRDEETYDAYDAGIRQEYWWVPTKIYVNKRAEILQGFLNRHEKNGIYNLDHFKNKYEEQAVKNLNRSLFYLSLYEK